MAKAKFEIKIEATRPLYAGVGVTDLAVEAVRDYVADVQKRVSGFDYDPKALGKQAVTIVKPRVDALTQDARELPARLQSTLDENVTVATEVYTDLATRGEALVRRIRRQQSTQATVSSARTTTAKAKTTKTQAGKATASTSRASSTATKSAAKKVTTTAKKTSAAPRSSVKATGTAAKKTAANAAKATSQAASKVGD